MQWKLEDIRMYTQAKEYVDTIMIPMLPATLQVKDEQLATMTIQSEMLSVFMNEIEKQFKGRILLSPSYTYSPNANVDCEIDRLNRWIEEAEAQGIEHVLLFTTDPKWKKKERKLNGSLVWIPAGDMDSIQSEEAQVFIQSQINQIIELITAYWQE